MPRTTRTAELHSAFVWDCDHCGAENFERAVEGGLDEQHMENWSPHLVADNEIEEGVFEIMHQRVVISPDRVSCRECKRIYRSVIWSPGIED